MGKKKAKPRFKDDCIYFQVLLQQTVIIEYRCGYYEFANVIISCGKDCPFYKRKEGWDSCVGETMLCKLISWGKERIHAKNGYFEPKPHDMVYPTWDFISSFLKKRRLKCQT